MVSDERKKLIMGLVLVFFMISSVFGVLFFGFNTGGGEARDYGEYTFKPNQNQWQVKIDGEKKLFYYHPLDIQHIEVPDDVESSLLNAKMMYFTSDVNSEAKGAIASSIFILSQTLNGRSIFPVTAFTTENSFNVPIITCENSTSSIPVVLMQPANSTTISREGNCIIIEGSDVYSFEQITERLLYMYYGVIA
jgi:hypothetical protein